MHDDTSGSAAIGDIFAADFNVSIVRPAQCRRVFQLRYRVFCEELGYGMAHRDGHESDVFDDQAIHYLLAHHRQRIDVGCARLISGSRGQGLPFERFGVPHVDPALFDMGQVDLSQCCEVSRLAVTPEFRRPLQLPGDAGRVQRFPFGVVSLYYASIALILQGGYAHAFMVAEPRLQRHLLRWGMHWRQISPEFEYYGSRAVFTASREALAANVAALPPGWRSLYDTVCDQLAASTRATSRASG